jgi:nicotinate phosphoribosyltransferase
VPAPGQKRLWRVTDDRGFATADVVSCPDEDLREMDSIVLRHPHREGVSRALHASQIASVEELLTPVFRGAATSAPTIDEMRARRRADVALLDPGVRRLVNPHVYHVSLTEKMKDLQLRLIREARLGA